MRELIKNKKITDYIYAKIKEGIWIQSDESYKYDKILIKKSFVETINIKSFLFLMKQLKKLMN